MGQAFPPMYGDSKFYQKKIAKSIQAIKEHTAIIEECFAEISKDEKQD